MLFDLNVSLQQVRLLGRFCCLDQTSFALPTVTANHEGNITIVVLIPLAVEFIECCIGIASTITRVEICFINAGLSSWWWPCFARPTFATNVLGSIAISVHVMITPIEIERCIGIAFTDCIEIWFAFAGRERSGSIAFRWWWVRATWWWVRTTWWWVRTTWLVIVATWWWI
jgi:hypothetical protein